MRLTRRFLKVGDRRVHYFRAGEGPPAVLIHSSPANARLLAPEIAWLSRDYTVFAFDTPGFGLSEPLPLAEMLVADLADALAQTLAVLGMPPCPVYGTHTGAAIALEFGVRHPERTTGVVLDGVPAFTTQECEALFGDYFRKLPASDLGGQYATVWTRFRDQSVWFPWSHRRPENLNDYDLGPPASTHLWVSMYFDAADTYTPAYRAASFYGARAVAAAAELNVPAVYTASDTDMLGPHLERLPLLKPGQEIARFGVSNAAKFALIADGFARFGSPGAAPADRDAIESSAGIERQFVDRRDGGQIHLRTAGDRSGPTVLLIHDAPGSAAQHLALIGALSARAFVIAPDLPGAGESDPFAQAGRPAIADYAAACADLLDGLGVERAQVHGVGFGSSVALELARTEPRRVAGLALQGLLVPEGPERAAMSATYAPPITIEPDGAHWYRTWLMLRDSQVWWPWCDRRMAALRRTPANFDAQRLHDWTIDVMRRHETYGDPIAAAFAHDAPAALAEVAAPLVRVIAPATPLSAHDTRLQALRPEAPSLEGDDLHTLADALSAFWNKDR